MIEIILFSALIGATYLAARCLLTWINRIDSFTDKG